MYPVVYHPQMTGLIEQFYGTLKKMLQKYMAENGTHLPLWLPFLLFVAQEVPQASTWFSPFELLFRRHHQGHLDVLQEEWEETQGGPISPY